ncbi:MAG TPA: hypothetical protein VFS49_03730, partial [Croceibacterium sp.]|nr:hypothetical protein [Croceibacterium sp.]
MKSLAALLTGLAVTISTPALAQDAVGDWLGVLEVGQGARLPLLVHIKQDEAGVLSGTMDSPTQGATGLPLAEIVVAGGRLTFRVPPVGGDYAGTWDAAAKTWTGEWGQGGVHLPLNLGIAPPPPPLPADWTPPADEGIRALIAA